MSSGTRRSLRSLVLASAVCSLVCSTRPLPSSITWAAKCLPARASGQWVSELACGWVCLCAGLCQCVYAQVGGQGGA
eukprot:14698732-Alexandrium_andersonii.AAC.1